MLTHLKDLFDYRDFVVMLGSFLGSVTLVFLGVRLPSIQGGASRLRAVQAVHSNPTPRVGGVAIFLSLVVGTMLSAGEATPALAQFFAAASVLFLAGFLEDIGLCVSPRLRLIAASLASAIVIFLLGMTLDRLDFAPADSLLAIGAVSIAFTIFMTAGGANGFNLIDGLNGLASFAAALAALGLSLIAASSGAHNLVHLCLMLAASVGGFLMLNFPFGKIFLGDAGAYTVGFVLVWIGVALVQGAPDVSPWAVLLTFFWPMAETLFTILRRLRSNHSALRPDRMHFHHLVLRSIEICLLGRRKRQLANPLATVFMLPFMAAPVLVGVLTWNDSGAAFWSVLAFCGIYGASYVTLIRVARRYRRRPSAGHIRACQIARLAAGSLRENA